MILITSRDPVTAPWASSVVDIELEPLGEKEAAGLIAALTDSGLDATQRRQIVEQGAGLPLFLQELTRSAVGASPDEVLPPRIHEILTARLRAPGVDLRVAQLAATLGAEFDEEPLRELAGRDVSTALFRLEDAALIERVAEVRLGRYRFRHGLMRDTAYETQVLPVRQKSHRSVAELLGATATTPGDLAVVAQHWDLAADVAQSVPAYILAAQAAQSTASHTEARQLLDRAQELAATLPEGDEQALTELMIRTQRTVSTSSLYGYGYPEVFDDFTVAEEICRRLTDRPEIMPAQVGIWSYLLVRGSVDAASVVLEPLTDVLDDPATAWFAPEIKSCMGYGAFYQGRLEDAHRWLVEAWEGYGARSADAASSPFWPLPHDAVPDHRGRARLRLPPCRAPRTRARCGNGGPLDDRRGARLPGGALQRGVRVGVSRLDPHDHGQRRRSARVRPAHPRHRGTVPLRLLPAARHPVRPDARSPTVPATWKRSSSTPWAWTSSGTGRSAPPISASSPRTTTISATPTRRCRPWTRPLERSASSGELVHQPDLLRLRAEIMAAASYPDRMAEAAKDLESAIDIGLAQGSLVLALRAANDLARLPA